MPHAWAHSLCKLNQSPAASKQVGGGGGADRAGTGELLTTHSFRTSGLLKFVTWRYHPLNIVY